AERKADQPDRRGAVGRGLARGKSGLGAGGDRGELDAAASLLAAIGAVGAVSADSGGLGRRRVLFCRRAVFATHFVDSGTLVMIRFLRLTRSQRRRGDKPQIAL